MNESKLNPEQRRAIEYTQGPLLIVAGAGTGKTTVVTQKIAYLIAQQFAEPQNILALTFTEKSAHEMQERVEQQLSLGYSDMQVSTFHSFAEKLLRDHGLSIGVSNQSKLLSTAETWMLFRDAIYDFDLDYSIDKVKSIIKDEYGVWSWDTLMDRCGGFVEAYNASLSTHPNSDNNI